MRSGHRSCCRAKWFCGLDFSGGDEGVTRGVIVIEIPRIRHRPATPVRTPRCEGLGFHSSFLTMYLINTIVDSYESARCWIRQTRRRYAPVQTRCTPVVCATPEWGYVATSQPPGVHYVMLFSGITLDGANGSLKADRWTLILRPLLTSHGGMVVIRRTPNA